MLMASDHSLRGWRALLLMAKRRVLSFLDTKIAALNTEGARQEIKTKTMGLDVLGFGNCKIYVLGLSQYTCAMNNI